MKKLILGFSILCILFSCNNEKPTDKRSNTEITKSATNTDQDQKKAPATTDEQSWDSFWAKFQNAVVKGNKEDVKKLTHFGALTEKELNDMYDGFFGGDYSSYFAKATAKDAKADESTFEGVEATNLMRFEIYESGEDEEGNEYESGISYYFGKIDGSYRLVYIVAAG